MVNQNKMSDQYDIIYHGNCGKGRTGAATTEVEQVKLALDDTPSPTKHLIEKVASRDNLKRAFKSVKRNKGAAGVDKISIKQVEEQLDQIIESTALQLLQGTYRPLPVKYVEIPKPDGNVRKLGIPSVIDRMVQQAIVQVLSPIIDPSFSNSSFGFRPKRKAIDAIRQASQVAASGKVWVVDIDIEQFFDQVNHDLLMALVARHIQDKPLLRLIRRFLTAGVMQHGVCIEKDRGTPQGGPLSPLLSNILLHELDLELEKRGHSFCRYADDCNIYLQSEKAAKRVLASLSTWISKRLKLSVNKTKSAADKAGRRKFLGFNILSNGSISIDKQVISRLKDKIRIITKRNRGVSIDRVIDDLNKLLRGWFHYFKWSSFPSCFKEIDAWIRRRLRCFRLKQRKRKHSIKTFLRAMGVDQPKCWTLALSDRGWWRKAFNPVIHQALPNKWFDLKGLFNLSKSFEIYQSETAVCDIARTVV